MLKLKLIFLPVCFFYALTIKGQEIPVIKYRDFKIIESVQNDTTYVINFWATWCSPCVKELPYFDSLAKKYEFEKVKVILISLDFVRQLSTRLIPFVKENKVQSEVLLLDEPDYNSWISKVDKSWSGAIPATLVLNNKNGIRKFYEQEFTAEELFNIIKTILK